MFAFSMQSLGSNSLHLSWFDGLVVAVLVFGLFRGRKNGMSKEILPLFKWLAIVFVSGLFYSQVAQWFVSLAHLDLLTSNILGYAILALVVFLIFSLLNRPLGLKLFGSNLFGNAEYYLGTPSGMVRYACVLVFALAFLNARHFTPAQIESDNKYQERWYGAHFFPGWYTVQNQVFEKSCSGPYIRKYVNVLLIEPTTTGRSTVVQNEEPAN
jgi:uncharacterized membrane protein required for colicin V production